MLALREARPEWTVLSEAVALKRVAAPLLVVLMMALMYRLRVNQSIHCQRGEKFGRVKTRRKRRRYRPAVKIGLEDRRSARVVRRYGDVELLTPH